MTTFTSYGAVASGRQAEIISALRQSVDKVALAKADDPDPATIARVFAYLQERAH